MSIENGSRDGDKKTESFFPPEHSLELKVPPVVVFGFFALVMWAISQYFPVFDVEIPFQYYLTAILMITAISTGLYSIYVLMKNATTLHAHKPDQTKVLITAGPYKHTRNPMYLSLSLILIGWAIFLSDLLALMLMPFFYMYMSRFQIVPEERYLLEKFEEEFESYMEHTPRWL